MDAPPDPRFDEIISIYNRTLSVFGCTASGVHWESAARQEERFALLSRLFDGPFTLNDFGCGYGAFFDYARDRLLIARYLGIDATPAMVAAARDRVTDPRATFTCATSITSPADYTIASGVFALLGNNPRPLWHQWVLAMLRQMWEFSRRGIAFNILRADAPAITDEFYWGDPDEFATWCRNEFSNNVELVTPVGANDWTIFVRRG